MSETNIVLKIQPPRSYRQKRRLAQRLRGKGYPDSEIKRIVWHRETSPIKPTKTLLGGIDD